MSKNSIVLNINLQGKKICNQAHVCKNETCGHKIPHVGECANSAPCYDFQWNAGRVPDRATVPISACVPVVDGKYFTLQTETCQCCLGKGRLERRIVHFIE